MGFFSFLGKMAKGEPVFTNSPDKADLPRTGSAQMQADGAAVNPPAGKVIPLIYARRVESRLDSGGTFVDCWVLFENNGAVSVFIDKINIFGTTRELDRILQAGETYEFEVFRGPAPTNGNYQTATVSYRDNTTGDYFEARFMLRYDLEASGVYLLDEMILEQPVRDI